MLDIFFAICIVVIAIAAFYFCAGRYDPTDKDPFQ